MCKAALRAGFHGGPGPGPLLIRILKMGGPVGGPGPPGLHFVEERLGGPGPQPDPILRMRTRRGPGPGPPCKPALRHKKAGPLQQRGRPAPWREPAPLLAPPPPPPPTLAARPPSASQSFTLAVPPPALPILYQHVQPSNHLQFWPPLSPLVPSKPKARSGGPTEATGRHGCRAASHESLWAGQVANSVSFVTHLFRVRWRIFLFWICGVLRVFEFRVKSV